MLAAVVKEDSRSVLTHGVQNTRRICTEPLGDSESAVQSVHHPPVRNAHRVDGVAVVSITAHVDVYLIILMPPPLLLYTHSASLCDAIAYGALNGTLTCSL